MSRMPVRVFEPLGIGTYDDKMGPDGELADPMTRAELEAHLRGFAELAALPAE